MSKIESERATEEEFFEALWNNEDDTEYKEAYEKVKDIVIVNNIPEMSDREIEYFFEEIKE